MTTSIAEIAVTQLKKVDENPDKHCLSANIRDGVTRRVPFVAVPEFIELEIETPALEKLYRILMRYARRGICDPSIRVLMRAMKRTDRTVQRYIRALVRLGKLVVQARRVTKNRNATNVYILPDLQRGVGDKNVTEKLSTEINTTTPAPEARVEITDPDEHKSALRKFWEARFAQDKRDSRWKQDEYQQKATFWESAKGWRLDKALERTRMAMKASVGVWNGIPTPASADDLADLERERVELEERVAVRREAERVAAEVVEAKRCKILEEKRLENERFESIFEARQAMLQACGGR